MRPNSPSLPQRNFLSWKIKNLVAALDIFVDAGLPASDSWRMSKHHALVALVIVQLLSHSAPAESLPPAAKADIDRLMADLQSFYVDLHKNPELSLQEQKTAKKIADRLHALGYEVTSGVGG